MRMNSIRNESANLNRSRSDRAKGHAKRHQRIKKANTPKTGFAAVEQAVEDILKFKASVVVKVPRAGMTTSLDKVCRRKKKRLCILEPTNKIMEQTLPDSENTIRIRANSFCKFNRQLEDEFPVLKNIPLPLPMDCRECPEKNSCEVYKPILINRPERIALTYQKLEALWLSEGNTAYDLLGKLYGMDVLFLDEAHTIIQSTKASLPYLIGLEIPVKYKKLNSLYEEWRELCSNNQDAITEVYNEGLENASSKHLARKIEKKTQKHYESDKRTLKMMKWERIAAALSELVNMVKEHGCTDNMASNIKDMIEILASDEVYINYITTDQGSSGQVMISAGASIRQQILADFISRYQARRNKTVIITSGTSIEPDLPGGFQRIAGAGLVYVLFPDFLRSTQTMTLIPSKWNLTGWNFNDKLARIIEDIKGITKHEGQPVYVIAPNSLKARVIIEKLAEDTAFWEKYSDSLSVDYYRSDSTMGVKRSERICIAVGFAEIPANSCDVGIEGKTEEERWLMSQAKRILDVDAATWQALCRVKDPEGKVESRVYCLGCRLKQVRRVAIWGVGRRLVLKKIGHGKNKGGEWRHPEFEVFVEMPLPLPKIRTEDATITSARSSRRQTADYIAWISDSYVEFIEDKISAYRPGEGFNSRDMKSKNKHFSSINIYRENVTKFRRNRNNEILRSKQRQCDLVQNRLVQPHLSDMMFQHFVSRKDAYGIQKPLGHGYSKVDKDVTKYLLMDHLRGGLTAAVYQIDATDDTVKWVCFDLDNHEGKNPNVRRDAESLIEVLRRNQIGFLLEASGSPDSYHLWVFLFKTKTINAYAFSQQIKRSSGVKCEVWPKQKHVDPSGYGNFVKLPLGINLKNGQRSVFLDPDTFEPLLGLPEYPGRVMLCEVEGNEYRAKPKSKERPISSQRMSSGIQQGKLRPCMDWALANSDLEGAEGNAMRHAIAVEAKLAGFTREETIGLFEHLPDFKRKITEYQVDNAWKNSLHAYNCETLKDKCPTLLANAGCERCYCNHSASNSFEREATTA
jgi:hypothetical protein